MGELLDFKIGDSRLVGSVTVPQEVGLEILVDAVKRLSATDGFILERKLKSGHLNKTEDWHQIFYPNPVVHWRRQDGSYDIEVHDTGNSHYSSFCSRDSLELYEHLEKYSE